MSDQKRELLLSVDKAINKGMWLAIVSLSAVIAGVGGIRSKDWMTVGICLGVVFVTSLVNMMYLSHTDISLKGKIIGSAFKNSHDTHE